MVASFKREISANQCKSALISVNQRQEAKKGGVKMAGKLTIALSKGTLLKPTIELFEKAKLPTDELKLDSRSMVFDYEDRNLRYIMCRPTDVPTYVEQGAADVGIVGKDVIVEQTKDVFELADLEFGYCRFVVAVPRELATTPLKDFN
ncbi:MAG TPA: ATP phosphoribosyltransferase, partial [Syntrophomonadaceae bacterium]|nr:ATP phosphoribosyltransferase [Syntrophomonadaceae bacterium]